MAAAGGVEEGEMHGGWRGEEGEMEAGDFFFLVVLFPLCLIGSGSKTGTYNLGYRCQPAPMADSQPAPMRFSVIVAVSYSLRRQI